MRLRSLIGTAALLAGLSFAAGLGCSSSNDNNNTGGTGGSTGGTGGSAGGAGGTAGVDSSAGGSAGGVTYANAAGAVFMAKCSPCHTTGGSASLFHTLASSSADATKDSSVCPGKKKGECALERVKNGSMPSGKGCSGDPTKDSANPACLTAAQQKVLEDWVAGGLK